MATRAAQKSGNGMMIVGGVAGAIGLILIINFMVGGSGDKPANAGTKPETPPAIGVPAPSQPAAPRGVSLDGEDRPGKAPRVAAPTIDPKVVARAEALYQTSKQQANDAVRARKAGDVAKGAELTRAAWDEIEKAYAEIETYSDWYNEADFEDWAIPGAYVAFAKRLGVWDKHRAKVQKLKTR